MRWDARSDENQEEVMTAIRELGGDCVSLHRLGQGAPDILGVFYGHWFVAEVKGDGAKLTPREREWHDRLGRHGEIFIWHGWLDVFEQFEKWRLE